MEESSMFYNPLKALQGLISLKRGVGYFRLTINKELVRTAIIHNKRKTTIPPYRRRYRGTGCHHGYSDGPLPQNGARSGP